MTYDFLIKAHSQPDLADFCKYIKKPLMALEDIQRRYQELQSTKKINHENVAIYHTCDSILQKHLPEMVDNFCEFSFDYRNNEKIKVDSNTSLTPKELLLKNLAKVIEEIQIIEKEFNRNNSFNAVVQNKVLEQYGYQPELCLETGKVVKKNIELSNEFDYEKFIEVNEFKKAPVEVQKELPKKEAVEDDTVLISSGSFSLEAIIVIILFPLLWFLVMSTYDKVHKENLDNNFAFNLIQIIGGTKALFGNTISYKDVSNEHLLNYRATSKEALFTPWETPIEVKPTTVKTKDDAFSLDFSLPNEKDEKKYHVACDSASKAIAATTVDIVKVDDEVVLTNTSGKMGNFVLNCFTDSMKPGTQHTINLIYKK